MIVFLMLIPWVLTVGALLFIMMTRKDDGDEGFMDDEDFMHDDEDSEIIRVAVYDEKAYWVYRNVFYESDITREPDWATARPIDTMKMPPKELNRLLAILDELEETERD